LQKVPKASTRSKKLKSFFCTFWQQKVPKTATDVKNLKTLSIFELLNLNLPFGIALIRISYHDAHSGWADFLSRLRRPGVQKSLVFYTIFCNGRKERFFYPALLKIVLWSQCVQWRNHAKGPTLGSLAKIQLGYHWHN